MSAARFGWSPEGHALVACHVYPDQAPILAASDSAEVSLTISSGTRVAVSMGHLAFAQEFAEAARRYAEECARWARVTWWEEITRDR